jgi:hypothetical protein
LRVIAQNRALDAAGISRVNLEYVSGHDG